MPTETFTSSFKNLERISDFVTKAAEEAGLDDSGVYAVQLAVDEACANIIEHAYGGNEVGDIKITTQFDAGKLVIVMRDKGQPFDPESVPAPKMNLPLEEISPRGLGVYLMHKMMDEVNYEFSEQDGNILTMTKRK